MFGTQEDAMDPAEPGFGEEPVAKATIGDDPPKVSVQCTTPTCSEVGVIKDVNAGVIIGDNVILYGTAACMICGNSMALVH